MADASSEWLADSTSEPSSSSRNLAYCNSISRQSFRFFTMVQIQSLGHANHHWLLIHCAQIRDGHSLLEPGKILLIYRDTYRHCVGAPVSTENLLALCHWVSLHFLYLRILAAAIKRSLRSNIETAESSLLWRRFCMVCFGGFMSRCLYLMRLWETSSNPWPRQSPHYNYCIYSNHYNYLLYDSNFPSRNE